MPKRAISIHLVEIGLGWSESCMLLLNAVFLIEYGGPLALLPIDAQVASERGSSACLLIARPRASEEQAACSRLVSAEEQLAKKKNYN